jgi:hypothetical protein
MTAASASVLTLIATDYVTQKHDCDEDGFDPAECVPCADCNHAECRHVMRDLPKPIDTTGMTPAQIVTARRVEAATLHAAITATPCDVDGCPCTRMKCGDECRTCAGDGCIEDPRTGRTYTCNACGGNGVVA